MTAHREVLSISKGRHIVGAVSLTPSAKLYVGQLSHRT